MSADKRPFRLWNMEKLIEYADSTGLELLPWQKNLLRRMEAGEFDREFRRIAARLATDVNSTRIIHHPLKKKGYRSE